MNIKKLYLYCIIKYLYIYGILMIEIYVNILNLQYNLVLMLKNVMLYKEYVVKFYVILVI